MSKEDQIRNMAALEQRRVPSAFSHKVEATLTELPQRPGRRAARRRWAGGIALLLALLLALPNMGPGLGRTLAELPVVGPVFQAVTFRDYPQL